MVKKILKTNKGSSILEALIAIAILTLGISAASMLAFSNQTLKLDSETESEALYKAKTILESARAESRDAIDFADLQSDPIPIIDGIYSKQLIVDPFEATECSKQIEAKVTYAPEIARPQVINLISRVVNTEEAFAMGGDCSPLPPTDPTLTKGTNGVNLGGDKTNGLDVFNRIAYITLEKKPGLAFVDGTDFNNPFQIMNGYDADSEVNDVDVARDTDTGKIYAYAVRETDIDQLQIIEVTNPNSPVFIRNMNLPEVEGSSEPEGYRVYYYNNRLYVTTKETAGPELHIFNATDPTIVLPKLGTAELNRTVNDFIVIDQNVGGTVYTLAYMVADSNLKEIAVLNVTNPGIVSEISTFNLLGGDDGYSINFSQASKLLYIGRQENGSEELYAFDASDPFTGLVEKAKNEVGINPLSIRVSGKYLYMMSDGSNKDFQIFDANPATDLSLIWKSNNSNKGAGLDYENNYIYTLFNQGSITLQIFYAP